MAAHAGGDANKYLLLTVSAVDLLLSAVIAAVLLTVVVMGAFGKGEDQIEAAELEALLVPTVVEIWSAQPGALRMSSGDAFQPTSGENEQIEMLMPGASIQSVHMLDGSLVNASLTVAAPGVAVVYVPDG